MLKLISLLTENKMSAAKNGNIVWLTNVKQKNSLESSGYVVGKINRSYFIDYSLAKTLSKFLNLHGDAVVVLSVDHKFNEAAGSFEVALCEDVQGKQFSVGNAFDKEICFKEMSNNDILKYVNKKV